MHASEWANIVSASVAVVSAIASAAAWLFARKAARRAAATEARIVNAVERIVDVGEARHQRTTELDAAEQDSPWDLLPIPGSDNCEVVNRTGLPQYHVHIFGEVVESPGVKKREVGPHGRVEVTIDRVLQVESELTVRWYTTSDKSDGVRSRRYDVPSRPG